MKFSKLFVSKRERRRREVEREALARGETPEQAAALAKETEREERKKAGATWGGPP